MNGTGYIGDEFLVKRIYLALYTIVFITMVMFVVNDNIPREPQTISRVAIDKKIVALTIDDGPHPKVTPEILAILKAKQVRATFFVLGINAEQFPRFLEQELVEGHEIGIHTYSHPFLSTLKAAQISDEFDKAEKVLMGMTPKLTLFRPPGGLYTSQVLEIARQRGYRTILWSIDTKDWSCPPKQKIIETVINNVKPGSIILMHDGQYPIPTPQVLGDVIDELRLRGYDFVTVSELLKHEENSRFTSSFREFF
ncbi:MAG: polysaccharide deacetylase family protein [Sporomusaceae bacterium]|nr:polysaccharide deacetylase family protein [Sporomusaceae bacterium]